MVRLVDAHCHLESEEFEQNLDDIVATARTAGVVALVTASIAPEQWDRSQAVAERFHGVFFALGVHPWYVKEEHFGALAGLEHARQRGAKAIGEIGLDRKKERNGVPSPPFDLQLRMFEAQLELAKTLDLPIVIHCRGAFEDLTRALRRVGVPERGGFLHAFSGSVELAEELMRFNLSFSMGGSLTYRNSRKRARVVQRIYPDFFLLETDSPDMPPVEARGWPNTPANILYNLKGAAEILGEAPEAIAERTTQNARRMFNLEL